MKVRLAAVAALALGLLTPGGAQANGAFPFVNQLVSNPDDPDQLVLRGTFGLVVSSDRGANWDWLCEAGMGYVDIMPPAAVLHSGVVILALPTGISRSDSSRCDFALASGITGYVVDVSAVRAEPGSAIALTVDIPTHTSVVWQSTDDGLSWAPLGDPIQDFHATTLDAAATDPDVIYVSGSTVGAGADDFLLRSPDRGETWQDHVVPTTTTLGSAPYIGAVDPDAVDTVYVRRDGMPGSLLVTRDGGATFDEVLQIAGPINSLALSPDGTTLLAGNLSDGLHRADTASLAVEQIACQGVTCLSWNEGGLYACGDKNLNQFLVGTSADDGESFEVMLAPSCVRGPLACDASTSTGGECPDDWPTIQASLGPTTCTPTTVPPQDDSCLPQGGVGGGDGTGGTGVIGTGGSVDPGSGGDDTGSGATGALSSAGGDGTGSAGDGPTGAGATTAATAPDFEPSGGCSIAPLRGRLFGLAAISALLLLGWRRRRPCQK